MQRKQPGISTIIYNNHCSFNKKQQNFSFFLSFFFFFNSLFHFSTAQTLDTVVSTSALKKLSLEDLMNIEVTSVSKHPEKLIEVASAIQVITQENIRHSGAKTVPEVLRLLSNLQVAQVNSSQWAISARGFNNVLANKLLVLIDGRTVYTPLYAGVFWDVQNLVLEDIERIEVISGPGGTLWGSNAVNGVINIITKSSKNTEGFYAEAAVGNSLPGMGSLRFGAKLSEKISYRVYGTGFKMGNTMLVDSTKANDEWGMVQNGFRIDYDATENDQLTFQGNIYDGNPNPDGNVPVIARGHNIIGKWTRASSEKSNLQLQLYYDHTLRDFGNGFAENLKTYDIDWQNRYVVDEKNTVTCGLGIRIMDHKVDNLALFMFTPARKVLNLYSSFIQDEIMLIKNRLRLVIGSKFEHNSYTGFEYQPSGRIAWTPSEHHTIWTAVSRAVRIPSRIDRDFYLYIAPGFPYISGDSLVSEELLAYELGWRLQPYKKISISFTGFYNVYDNLRSVEPGPPPFNLPITFGNGVQGETYGGEMIIRYHLADWWSLRGGYTLIKKNLWVKPDSKDLNMASAESNDPENQVLLQSMMNLPGHIELSTVVRYVDILSKPYVPDYCGIDVRIGWRVNKNLELNVIGQDLLYDRHIEFIPSSPSTREIKRSIYGKIVCRF